MSWHRRLLSFRERIPWSSDTKPKTVKKSISGSRIMGFEKQWGLVPYAVLVAGLLLVCVAEVISDSGPQPSFRLNLSQEYELALWKGDALTVFHRTAKGQLAPVPGQNSLGKPHHALTGDDQGRTWRQREAFGDWPKMA
jgi:hypothetical protein